MKAAEQLQDLRSAVVILEALNLRKEQILDLIFGGEIWIMYLEQRRAESIAEAFNSEGFVAVIHELNTGYGVLIKFN